MINQVLVQRIAGALLIGCAAFVFWKDRKGKVIEHEPAPPAPPKPPVAPPADDPDPARPGASA